MATETANKGILGASAPWRKVIEQIDAVAETDVTVLLLGESGVGKELIAQELHERSGRRGGSMVTVNCATVPENLFESEFFGHVRGAFTGASQDRVGRVEASDGGTLFLDEVGEIPTESQAKLLRTIQNREFTRVGATKSNRADVRFVAATNRDLRREVAAGRFRRDLYYRLCVFPIEIPPLRARPDDIEVLAQLFLEHISQETARPSCRLTKAHVQLLRSYDWPGNVRELKNLIERAFILARGGELPLGEVLPKSAISFAAHLPQLAEQNARRGFFNADEFRQLERENLIGALEATRWKVSGRGGAAELLGMRPSTLASRMKTLEIDRPGTDSLYARLGGHRGISTFARELFGRAVSDPQLGRFWQSRSNTGVLREEQLLIAYLSAMTGGPGRYVGRDMKTAHVSLGITDADWAAFLTHLSSALEALRIGPRERREVERFAESLRSDIAQA